MIKQQVIEALSHSEAEEGLYLDNLLYVHEEEDRRRVEGTEIEVLDALKELIAAGEVEADESGEKVVFKRCGL